jgi:hypothetical protein
MDNLEFLSFKEPITIEWIDIYRDGGSIGVLLVDAKGQGLSFHVDGAFGSPTRDRLFINSSSPSHKPAELIPKGDKREKAIIQILKTILDREFSAEEQTALRGSYGRRKLSEEERKAALNLSVIETLEKPG